DPGRPVRRAAGRAARRAADPPPGVLPARQHPQGPPPRPALAPHGARGRADLPQPARRRARGLPVTTGAPATPGRHLAARPARAAGRVTGECSPRPAGGPPPPVLRSGSLCTGYGGLDLAAAAVL